MMTSTTMRRVVIAGAIAWFEVPAGDLDAATRVDGAARGAAREAETCGGHRATMFALKVDGRVLTPVLVLPDDGIGGIARMFEAEGGRNDLHELDARGG